LRAAGLRVRAISAGRFNGQWVIETWPRTQRQGELDLGDVCHLTDQLVTSAETHKP
jgi:hypothetical protein